MVAVPRPLPAPRPVPLPADPANAIVYQRGYESRENGRVLIERWVLPGAAFRERTTLDGVLLADRSDGREVDYGRRVWRAAADRRLEGDCVRTPAHVEAGLADGTVTVFRQGVLVGGEEMTVLRDHGSPVVDLWVTPGTSRAVRCRVAEWHAVTFDLMWLPATEANLAQLVAVIPDDFDVRY